MNGRGKKIIEIYFDQWKFFFSRFGGKREKSEFADILSDLIRFDIELCLIERDEKPH